jgi:hypothetical protein
MFKGQCNLLFYLLCLVMVFTIWTIFGMGKYQDFAGMSLDSIIVEGSCI